MKIGLLTYHRSSNNGAMLQTYATCRALKELGHDVQIVDIRQPEVAHTNPVVKLLVRLIYLKREYDTLNFRKKFYAPLTCNYSSIDQLRKSPPYVDCLIVGSDQTWNPNIAKDVLLAYFLDFGSDETRRISYASSFGLSEWPKSCPFTGKVYQALKRFSSLSTRENTGVRILKETFDRESTLVVDPTMLFNEYHELVSDIKENNEIVCYKIHRNTDFYAHVGKVKSLVGIPVRLLNNSFPVKGLRYTYPPSVAKWIRLIAGAKYVVTDSFHGCVFSILYKRRFAAILSHNGKDSRLLDLLKELGLEDRVFSSMEALSIDTSWLSPIDYETVDKKIEKLREKSWTYLKAALNK